MNAYLGVNKIEGLRNFSRALWGAQAAPRKSLAIAGQLIRRIASNQIMRGMWGPQHGSAVCGDLITKIDGLFPGLEANRSPQQASDLGSVAAFSFEYRGQSIGKLAARRSSLER
jgi:hypothetical protein